MVSLLALRARQLYKLPQWNPRIRTTNIMTSAIVLPKLSDWAKGRISALFEAKTEAEFEEAFDFFLSKHVHITINGDTVTRETAKQRLQQDRAAAVSTTVSFPGVVQVDKEASNDFKVTNILRFHVPSILDSDFHR